MKVMWVILNETKDAVVELFETESSDSKVHWEKFYKHRSGCVFCARVDETRTFGFSNGVSTKVSRKWYVNYFFWDDMARWGYGDPNGMGWSACMTLPEPIRLLEMLEDSA